MTSTTPRGYPSKLLAVLTGLFMLAITYVYWRNEEHELADTRAEVFAQAVDQIALTISRRVASYELVLRGVKGFYESADHVSRDDYLNYVNALELEQTQPGLQGLGVAVIVPLADRARHVAAMRKDGFTDYGIKPDGERSQYVPLVLMEPRSQKNLSAIGFDLASSPALQPALAQARDTGTMSLTGRMNLVQDAADNFPAVVMYVPIYARGLSTTTAELRRAAIVGWVDGPFRVADLIVGLGSQLSSDIDVSIFENNRISPDTLLYGRADAVEQLLTGQRLHATRTLDVGGQRWTLSLTALPGFDERFPGQYTHRIIAAVGAFGSLLLGWFAWLLATGRERAVALARAMTKNLQALQADQEATLDAMPDILFELGLDGRYYKFRTSRTNLLAAPPENIVGKLISDLLPAQATATCLSALQEAHATGYSTGKQIEISIGDELRWYELSVARKNSVALQDPRFVMISRDITDRKRVEHALINTNRALKTMSACNDALVHATDETTLLDSICRLIVETGGYRMAWAGRAESNADKIVRPIARYGTGTDYLSEVKISWADDEWGRGPTGSAVRCARVQVNQNYHTNPAVAMWGASAIKHGFRASIALPLMISAGDANVLTIYAAESDAFDPVEVKLLEELARNVVYGIDGMRNRVERLALADQNRKLSLTVEQSPESVVITDLDGRIEYVNEAFLSNTGYTNEEIIGKTPHTLQSGRTSAKTYTDLWQTLRAGQVWKGEFYNRRKDGSEYTELAVISPIRDASGAITHYVALKEDITAKKAAEERILHLAYYDSLTNLPNRRLLIDRLQAALTACTRSACFGALFYIDIDNFKTINDTLGHDIGDQLLEQVATRLSESVTPADTVATLGGDDFFILLPDLGTDPHQAQTLIKALGDWILACFHAPFAIGRTQCRTTPSIGVTLFGHPQDTVEEILKQVDLAMFEAKAAGRNTLRFFDAQVQAAVIAEAALVADLHTALERGEFRLHYQIQVDDSSKPVGAEALVRWQHPQRGLLTPEAFIGTAEKTSLIVPIGEWVLESACAQLAAWATKPEMRQLTLAVNVSAKQLSQPDFVYQCLAILARTGADPDLLKLESTESLLHEDIEETIAKITALRAQGVRFALDDFGTGYSSLAYLRRLPLDQLKIDQSFVRDIPDEPNACAIVRTIVVLGQSLGLAVIAEGVETREQRMFLAENGCRLYQGYLYGRPLPIEAFEAEVKRNSSGLNTHHLAIDLNADR